MNTAQLPNLSTQITEAANFGHELGEGPLWIERENRLYWLDIEHGRLYRYAPETGDAELAFQSDRPIGGIAETEDGALALFMDRGAVVLWKDGTVGRTIVESIEREVPNRFNDCIVDPEGRVFVGSLHREDPSTLTGNLHRIDPDGSVHLVKDGVGIANGMAFTPDLSGFFFTDSFAKTIWKYDYDRATGELSNECVFLQFDPESKNPDGMTIDTAGNLWVAQALHSHIEVFSPEGASLACIETPAKFTSSLTFGGPDYRTLFVTTGHSVIPGLPREEWGPSAGALLTAPAPEGVQGRPEFKCGFAW